MGKGQAVASKEKQMRIGGLTFRREVCCTSGARNFFGDGFSFHRLFRRFGWSLDETNLVTKTATLHPLKGNMPLNGTHPNAWWPNCIIIKWFRGVTLNSVGLSNPGLLWLLEQGEWQKLTAPFVISVTSVASSFEQRRHELEEIVAMLAYYRGSFLSDFALEDNLSCPNTGEDTVLTPVEVTARAEVLKRLGAPVIAKLAVTESHEIIREAADQYDAVCIGNTIPFGDPRIDWVKYFGSMKSPLQKRGFTPGGFSGPEAFILALHQATELRRHNPGVVIIVANGIRSVRDVYRAKEVKAYIALGTCLITRPWRVRQIVRAANKPSGSPV